MNWRRVTLGFGVVGLVVSAAQRPRAETELEAAGYEGSTTGTWICGPRARARYGGVGARVRHSEHRPDARRGAGATVVAGAAVEYEHVELLRETDHSDREFGAPSVGIGARVGHHWQYFGFELGALSYTGFSAPDQVGFVILPQVEISMGRRDGVYGVLGVGSPEVTHTRRPAMPYGGLGILHEGYRLELRFGAFRTGPPLFDDLGPRLDVAWYVPIERTIHLRSALAVGGQSKYDREASLGVAWGFE